MQLGELLEINMSESARSLRELCDCVTILDQETYTQIFMTLQSNIQNTKTPEGRNSNL